MSDPPFKGIALAMSGGGYRAASFHLGTLRIMEKLGLLDQIRALSTISGGTIVGAAYIKSLVDGKPFDEFAAEFKLFLKNTNVIKEALDRLTETRKANGLDVMPSLIRSAANVYDNYFEGMKFGAILDADISVEDISFNTTEFKTGKAFRFQTGKNVYSGNRQLRVPKDSRTNRTARVADIVGASSCFPSGFEPVRFPSGFEWDDLDAVKTELGEKFKDEIPLMDGGVYDNQGLDSIQNIFRRVKRDNDLLIISDTDPKSTDYLLAPVAENKGIITITHLYFIVQILLLVSFISAVAFGYDIYREWGDPNVSWFEWTFLKTLPLFFSATVFCLILWLRTLVTDGLDVARSSFEIPLWESFKKLRLREVIEFVSSRITSLIAMSSSVFMKRIRDLQYEGVLSDDDLNKTTIVNQIYSLTRDPSKNTHDERELWEFIEYDDLTPTQYLKDISEIARKYSTNLWFLESDETNLDNLIKCGEASFCYSILKFLLTQKQSELRLAGSPSSILFDNAANQWKQLK